MPLGAGIGFLAVGLALFASCAQVNEPSEERETGLPEVARLVCEEDGTRLLTERVRPLQDGDYFELDNRTGRDLGFDYPGGGENADAGNTELVLALPPGSANVRCAGEHLDPPYRSDFVAVEVVDEEGLWVAPELDCERAVTGTDGLAPGAEGEEGNPVDLARRHFADRLMEGDVVEAAGYPEAEERIVRVVRDGGTVATVTYVNSEFATGEPGGGWFVGETTTCEEF